MEWKVSVPVRYKFQPDSTCRTHSRDNRTFRNSKRSGSSTPTTAQCEVGLAIFSMHSLHSFHSLFAFVFYFFLLVLLWVSAQRNGNSVLIRNGVTKISFDSQPSSASVFSSNTVPNETSAFTIQCKLADRKINSNLRISEQLMCEYGGTQHLPIHKLWMNIETICLHLRKNSNNIQREKEKNKCKNYFRTWYVCAWYFASQLSTSRYEFIFGCLPESHSNYIMRQNASQPNR